MNKKIKVIELLNKIANREEVPKRIRYERYIWILGKMGGNTDYLMEKNNQALFSNYLSVILIECLTDEVEILEDNTEEIEELDLTKKQNIWDKLSMCEDKINELVEAVNQIRKDLKNE